MAKEKLWSPAEKDRPSTVVSWWSTWDISNILESELTERTSRVDGVSGEDDKTGSAIAGPGHLEYCDSQ